MPEKKFCFQAFEFLSDSHFIVNCDATTKRERVKIFKTKWTVKVAQSLKDLKDKILLLLAKLQSNKIILPVKNYKLA